MKFLKRKHKPAKIDAKSWHAAKLQSLGELTASLAHEISSPLTSIDGYVFQMLREIEENDKPSKDILRTALERIKYNADRMSTLTKALRSFSRQDSMSAMEALSVSDLLQDSLTLVQHSVKNAGVTLEMSLPFEDVEVRGHFSELSQILVNLIANARDACAASQDRKIIFGFEFDNELVRIFVEDSGPGVPSHIKKKMFTPFFTTKGVGKGTGLGLSISKSIAESHKAKLLVVKGKTYKSRFELVLARHKRDEKAIKIAA